MHLHGWWKHLGMGTFYPSISILCVLCAPSHGCIGLAGLHQWEGPHLLSPHWKV